MALVSPMISRACAVARRVRNGEGGFTMVEITVGIFLVSVGLMAVASSFDVFRTLITSSSHRNVAAHVADQELERLASIGWKDLVLAADPGASSDPKDPRSGVVAGSPPQYRPDSTTALAPLSINSTNPAAIAVTKSWNEAGVSGTIYRFITRSSDPGCGTTCPKRVTVAVTINRASGNPPDPVTASTVVSETQDKNADENVAPPPPPPGPSFMTLYPTDTKASIGTRQEPSADHIVHESNRFPDLMVATPPPNPNDPADPPPIRLFSQEYRAVFPSLVPYTAAGYPGGRVIEKDSNCDNTGDRKKVHWWVTNPLAATVTLTGNVGGSIFTQIAGETAGNVILCLTVYDVVKPLKADGSFDGGSTKLNGNYCGAPPTAIRITSDVEAFPDSGGVIEPRPISVSGRFLGCNIATQQIAAGHRIAIALTVRDKRPKGEAPVLANDIPASDAVVLYDHYDYPSTLGIETTAPFIP